MLVRQGENGGCRPPRSGESGDEGGESARGCRVHPFVGLFGRVMYGKHKSQNAGLSLEPTRNSLSEMIHSLCAAVRLIGGQNHPDRLTDWGGGVEDRPCDDQSCTNANDVDRLVDSRPFL